MRVNELMASCQNDPDRIVILDSGCIYPYNKKCPVDTVKYGCRNVKSFLLETIHHKTTLFIELKGEKNDQM